MVLGLVAAWPQSEASGVEPERRPYLSQANTEAIVYVQPAMVGIR